MVNTAWDLLLVSFMLVAATVLNRVYTHTHTKIVTKFNLRGGFCLLNDIGLREYWLYWFK